jgi:hypothetical protein
VNATVPDAPDPQPGHTETPVTVPSVPLVISVTGHANLVPAEMPLIRARVRQFLEQMLQLSPHLPLRVMTSLAEGADRLVAEEALALGIPLVAILPMPRAL